VRGTQALPDQKEGAIKLQNKVLLLFLIGDIQKMLQETYMTLLYRGLIQILFHLHFMTSTFFNVSL